MKNQLLLLTTSLLISITSFGQVLNDTVVDVDGNVYHTIKIGTQVWMVENLKTTRYRDRSEIPNGNYSWNDAAVGSYCDYGNKSYYSQIHGRLYNWHAAVDSRNICPTGWHVPSDDEWDILEKYLISISDTTIAENGPGGELKELGTTHWNSPNTGGTNSTGFRAIASGRRSNLGFFTNYQQRSYWWSSTSANDVNAWFRSVKYDSSEITRLKFNKAGGFSIRCIKDQ
ncbi:MAG: fibrobacter succinogenes major paralogous domain-containing protein [Crocinitomicaceae bacterium]|nr:fibrobacter succinogenes major paralogous domain-containing protein [Crocinitomicaceae bacterium]